MLVAGCLDYWRFGQKASSLTERFKSQRLKSFLRVGIHFHGTCPKTILGGSNKNRSSKDGN